MITIDKKLILGVIGTILTIVIVVPFISPLWKQIVFVVFAIYTTPLLNLRKQFRSIVYNDDSWTINVKPVFLKEMKALFSNKYFNGKDAISIANRYRIYLIGYTVMLLLLTL